MGNFSSYFCLIKVVYNNILHIYFLFLLISVERDSKIDEIIDIPDVMFNPARLRQVHFYDAITETLMFQPMQQVDDSITKGVSIVCYF